MPPSGRLAGLDEVAHHQAHRRLQSWFVSDIARAVSMRPIDFVNVVDRRRR